MIYLLLSVIILCITIIILFLLVIVANERNIKNIRNNQYGCKCNNSDDYHGKIH